MYLNRQYVRVMGLVLVAIFSAPRSSWAGNDGEMRPDNVVSGDNVSTRGESFSRAISGVLWDTFITCNSDNLRGVPMPMDGVAYSRLAFVIKKVSTVTILGVSTSVTVANIPVTLTFHNSLFFGNPGAPVSLSQAPAGSRGHYYANLGVYRANLNIVREEQTVNPDGTFISVSNRLVVSNPTMEQIGVPYRPGPYQPTNGFFPDSSVSPAYVSGNTAISISAIMTPGPGQIFTGYGILCIGWYSPLYLTFDQRQATFTGESRFPLNPRKPRIRWPEPGAPGYFLAMDRDGNGRINRADELFGDQQTSKNGFEELKKLDANQDNVFDKKDPDFTKVVLWRDVNGDGESELSELFTLKQKRLISIDLKYDPNRITELPHNVELRERSTFKFADKNGKVKTGNVVDVWLGTIGPDVADSAPPKSLTKPGMVPILHDLIDGQLFTPRTPSWKKSDI